MTTEKIITSLDQHGRMLIPSNIRERFNISPNDKVTIELTEDALVIRNVALKHFHTRLGFLFHSHLHS